MFTEQLNFHAKGSHPQSNNGSFRQRLEAVRFTQADMEYEICSTFMKHTGQRLSSRESQLMEDSRKFIQTYGNFKKKQMDTSQTLDTLLEDITDASLSLDEDRSFGLNRKNPPTFGSRKNIQVFSDHLSQIQEKCSSVCFSFFNGLVAEYKKMQNKIKFYQSKESLLIKKEDLGDKFHQQNVILKKKLEYQSQKIRGLQSQIQLLKEKNRSINSCINQKINNLSANHKYFQINHKVYRDIRNYLQEKEALLSTQSERLSASEAEMMKAIEQAFREDSCGKCCQILRKLKESIIKYRKYLQGQSIEMQKLYDKYKKTMYSVKSRPSI